MELRDALDQVAEIRQRMAEAETFRGYRAVPAAFAGLVAIAAGVLQPWLVPDPVTAGVDYVLFWGTVAGLSLGAAMAAMWLRDHRARALDTTLLARIGVAALVPCLVAGVCVTIVLVRLAPDAIWLLPGLWQLLYSQGLFASCRTLPRPMFAVPSFFLAAGLCTLCFARGPHALSPLAMALPFGAGQLLAAAILYWTLERHDRAQDTAARA
jgi:hypothetical protein